MISINSPIHFFRDTEWTVSTPSVTENLYLIMVGMAQWLEGFAWLNGCKYFYAAAAHVCYKTTNSSRTSN